MQAEIYRRTMEYRIGSWHSEANKALAKRWFEEICLVSEMRGGKVIAARPLGFAMLTRPDKTTCN